MDKPSPPCHTPAVRQGSTCRGAYGVRQTAKTHVGHYPIFIPLTNIPLTSFPFFQFCVLPRVLRAESGIPLPDLDYFVYFLVKSLFPSAFICASCGFPHKTRMIHPFPAYSIVAPTGSRLYRRLSTGTRAEKPAISVWPYAEIASPSPPRRCVVRAGVSWPQLLRPTRIKKNA
jgi:hypothetical protein